MSVEETKEVLQKERQFRMVDVRAIRFFFAVLFVGMILALIPFLRPKYSESERRNLTKFPKFTWSALASGDYFDGISLWFSDTFPFRDQLMTLNGYVTDWFGESKIEIHGTVDKGDDIPTTPAKPSPESSSDVSSSEPAVPHTVEQMGAVLLVDDAAYEYYNFQLKFADAYIGAVNRAASMLKGKATVYDAVVPTGMAIAAPRDVAAGVNSSDQKKAIGYLYNGMSADVKTVDVYKTLDKHRKEYLYFRTDHHWTARAAYYAYEALTKAAGKKPYPLDHYEERRYDGFLGTFYASTGKSPKLAANPDTVFAYVPPATNTMYVHDVGKEKNIPIIQNADPFSPSDKYLTFLGGDRPLCVIQNPNLNDSSKCLIVKESYGNALTPFLTENYQTVYAIDYRKFAQIDPRKLAQFVTDNGIQDVFFVNNISATRSEDLVAQIAALVG